LYRIREPLFNVLEGSLGSAVQSVCADSQGGLWVGYNTEKVEYWRDGKRSEYTVSRPPVALAVRAVFVDRQGEVWAGTYNGGLFRLIDGHFVPDPGFDAIANPRINAIYEDSTGSLWVGTEGGLARRNGDQWRTYGMLHGLAGNSVRALASDNSGHLSVGSDGGGLTQLSPNTAMIYTSSNGLPGNFITALEIDSQGILWVGTSSGLGRFDGQNWITYTTRQGMAGNSIRYILDDRKGSLWIGSNAGLMRVDRGALAGLGKRDATFRVYGKADGLPSRECTQDSQPAAWRDGTGRLWFATIRGVAWLDPTKLRTNTNPPPVQIEAVLLDGEQKSASSVRALPPKEIVVPPKNEALEILYTSLNLAHPDQGRFMYRLNPWNKSGQSAQRRAFRPI
jgi:ligand-binding sensor domain-containing protein